MYVVDREKEQDKAIKRFITGNNNSKKQLFQFLQDFFVHPDLEVEFTDRVTKNMVEITHSYYLSLPRSKKLHFLKAVGNLLEVALSMKIWEFSLSRNDAAWFWGGTPTFFQSITHLTKPLENIRYQMGLVDQRKTHNKVLLVEGDAEHSFMSTIRDVTGAANFDVELKNYKGKGNVQNLVYYIKEKNRQGVRVLLTYDKDASSTNFVKKVRKRKCKLGKTFGFRKDFEGAFPPLFLKTALETYMRRYCDSRKSLDVKLIRRILRRSMPFIKSFENEYNVGISKAKLGIILGEIMSDVLDRFWNDIFNKKKRQFSSEIFKFLKFVMSG